MQPLYVHTEWGHYFLLLFQEGKIEHIPEETFEESFSSCEGGPILQSIGRRVLEWRREPRVYGKVWRCHPPTVGDVFSYCITLYIRWLLDILYLRPSVSLLPFFFISHVAPYPSLPAIRSTAFLWPNTTHYKTCAHCHKRSHSLRSHDISVCHLLNSRTLLYVSTSSTYILLDACQWKIHP